MAFHASVKEHKEPLKDKDILCPGHLKRVFAMLDCLHDTGCGRDRAGNIPNHGKLAVDAARHSPCW